MPCQSARAAASSRSTSPATARATGAHTEIARLSRASRPQRVYVTKEEAIRRFRTVPAQPESLPCVLGQIAQAARAEGGWTWQTDPLIFGHDRFPPDGIAAIKAELASPVHATATDQSHNVQYN
jgi:hypothetical protein